MSMRAGKFGMLLTPLYIWSKGLQVAGHFSQFPMTTFHVRQSTPSPSLVTWSTWSKYAGLTCLRRAAATSSVPAFADLLKSPMASERSARFGRPEHCMNRSAGSCRHSAQRPVLAGQLCSACCSSLQAVIIGWHFVRQPAATLRSSLTPQKAQLGDTLEATAKHLPRSSHSTPPPPVWFQLDLKHSCGTLAFTSASVALLTSCIFATSFALSSASQLSGHSLARLSQVFISFLDFIISERTGPKSARMPSARYMKALKLRTEGSGVVVVTWVLTIHAAKATFRMYLACTPAKLPWPGTATS
mmetsp:Transcript_68712/g.201148  ORF Transcript_68712/g.201148 Transcript_68712/m.201148 type:complete len:301 (+) Transcript_68712:31-933(+)